MKKINCSTYTIFINDWSAINTYVAEGDYSSILVLVDENTSEQCLPIFAGHFEHRFDIIEIESGEINKDLETCNGIWASMLDFGADRHSLCINLGGGVIGDMGGFTASTFMRGMDFVQIPTTLLSQVDASVGGKLGVDFNAYKNLIGIIRNPGAVFMFTEFLSTLPAPQLLSGYAEVIKHGLIQDKDAYHRDIASTDISELDWEELVFHSVNIKKTVTDQDPNEKGLRKILNFGHTLGHAIESYNLDTANHLLHGEAIAIGMIMEAHLSYQKGYLGQKSVENIKSEIVSFYGHFPERIPDVSSLIELMTKDKKNKGGQIMFSLLEEVGKGNYNQEVTEEQIRSAVEFYKN